MPLWQPRNIKMLFLQHSKVPWWALLQLFWLQDSWVYPRHNVSRQEQMHEKACNSYCRKTRTGTSFRSRKAVPLLRIVHILFFTGLTEHSHNRQRAGSVFSPVQPSISQESTPDSKDNRSLVAIAYPFDQVLEVTIVYPKPCCFPRK